MSKIEDVTFQDEPDQLKQVATESTQPSHQDQDQVAGRDIEDIPVAFAEIMDSLIVTNLSSYPTFLAWRLGFSERFLDEALLPALQSENISVLVPLWRSIWLGNLKDVHLRTVASLESSSVENLAPVCFPERFLTIYDAKNQKDGLRVIERLMEQAEIGLLTSEVERKIVVLAEIFGPLEDDLVCGLRRLMRDGAQRGILLWLHAEVANIPRELLDQFQNHIVILPSQAEVEILGKTQPLEVDKAELRKRLNIVATSGPCVDTVRFWKTICLSDSQELEEFRDGEFANFQRHPYRQAILAIYSDSDNLPIGTGFLASFGDKVFVVTCAHVLMSLNRKVGETVRVEPTLATASSGILQATIRWMNVLGDNLLEGHAQEDIALLDFDTPLEPQLKPLELSPQPVTGKSGCYCFAYVRSRQPRGTWIEGISCGSQVGKGFIELDQLGKVRIEYGASGAPLSDKQGNILGMIQSAAKKEGVAYLTPAKIIIDVLELLAKEET